MTCEEFQRLTSGNFFATTTAERAAICQHSHECQDCNNSLQRRVEEAEAKANLDPQTKALLDQAAQAIVEAVRAKDAQDPEAMPSPAGASTRRQFTKDQLKFIGETVANIVCTTAGILTDDRSKHEEIQNTFPQAQNLPRDNESFQAAMPGYVLAVFKHAVALLEGK